MANFQTLINVQIDPTKPVEEINNVIVGLIRMHTGKEREILQAVRDGINVALKEQAPMASKQEYKQNRRDRRHRGRSR